MFPITSEYGFIEADFRNVAEWYRVWDTSIQAPLGRRVEARAIDGSLESMLHQLEPLTSPLPTRVAFVEADGGWCAYFENGVHGADGARLSHVAKELRCRALRVAAVADTLGNSASGHGPGRYGATILEVYGPVETTFLNYVRSIAVVNDGGRWRFAARGEPLEGEDTSSYRARRVQDRFDITHLDRCAKLMGVRPFDETFFGHAGRLLERKGPMPSTFKEHSLVDVRAACGL